MKVWQDLCDITTSPHCPEASTLGLQQIHDSLDLLSKSYISLRLSVRKTAYSAVSAEYVPLIGLFLRHLCYSMISKWAEDVAMEMSKMSQGEPHNSVIKHHDDVIVVVVVVVVV